MLFQRNENDSGKQNTFLYAFFVILASMIAYFFIFKTATIGTGIRKVIDVLNPLIYGGVIAYVLNPVMQALENGIFALADRMNHNVTRRYRKWVRVISTFLAIAIALVIIYALIATVFPQLIDSVQSIVRNFPLYVRNVNNFIEKTFSGSGDMDTNATEMVSTYGAKIQQWLSDTVTPLTDDIVSQISVSVLNLISVVQNVFLGFIISIYILISKETMKARFYRFIYALLPIPTANRTLHNIRFVDEKFGGFLIGKIIDSAIIGFICYFAMLLLRMPYAVLIAVFIGLTNIIPFFGPFIGAIPSMVLIFVVNPIQALYFLIFILILQQFDGNLLGPKILGNSVGISSFMVVVSILVGSGFFGFVGMIIGVPLFAILTAVGQTLIIERMHKKHLPTDLEAYHNVGRVRGDTHEVEPPKPDMEKASLYSRIKKKSVHTEKHEYPIRENAWDITYDEIRKNKEYADANTEKASRSELLRKSGEKK